MAACSLVPSQINHTRHGHPSHFLARKGLSVWLDLDRLDQANAMSVLFSTDRFNLLSVHQRDYGPNFRTKQKSPFQLADYARAMAAEIMPDVTIATVHLLTFPRILGLAFNPISVYVLRDIAAQDRMYIYEVRNTFGDMHSYIGQVSNNGAILTVPKKLHVSPFFSLDGGYRLRIQATGEGPIRVLMRYSRNRTPLLTATLRGERKTLTTKAVITSLLSAGQWPLRPLVSIHVEAFKLWMKKVPFFRRPEPPAKWSPAQEMNRERV